MPKVVRDFLVLNLELFNLKIRRVSKKNATVSNLHTMIVISHPPIPNPQSKMVSLPALRRESDTAISKLFLCLLHKCLLPVFC